MHSVHDFVGRMVEEVIPNTQMRQGLAARGDHTLPAQRLHHVLRLTLRALRYYEIHLTDWGAPGAPAV